MPKQQTEQTPAQKILASWEDGHIARYRCGLAGRDGVKWDVWKTGPFYVQKFKGAVVVLAPKDEATAEYDPRWAIAEETQERIVLNGEEYYLEIEIDKAERPAPPTGYACTHRQKSGVYCAAHQGDCEFHSAPNTPDAVCTCRPCPPNGS